MTTYPLVSLSSGDSSTATATTDESDPLLHVPKPRKPQPNPLPVAQIAVMYAIKLTLPIVNTQSIPYYNVLIVRLAASEGAGQCITAGFPYEFPLSDWQAMSVQRLTGSAGWIAHTSLSGTALFTVSPEVRPGWCPIFLTLHMVPRAGFFFGITGAIHSVVDELSDETNQSTAFPLYDIISTLGFMISPLIGDTFAEPASEWPDAFTHPAWTTYPYLLPCLISAAVAVVAAVLARFALEEGSSDFNHFVWFLHPYTIGKAQTLLSKRTRKTPLVEEEPLIDTGASAAVDVPPTLADLQPLGVRALLALPVLRAVFLASGGIGFAGSCFTNVFVLMAYTPLRQGGLALSPAQIGRAISAMGALSIAPKLCTPKLLRRFGTLGRFDFAMPAWVATFATMPLASLVAQRTASAAEWAAVGLVLFLSRLGCLAFSIIMIPTRALTPGSASLGTANGLAELTQSLAGAVSPTVVNSLFAFSASRHLLGGHLWVVFMLLESGFGCWVARRIRRYH